MKIIYAKEPVPSSLNRSLFLAGPTPRSANIQSWRPEALKRLEEQKYDGIVFVPEPRDGNWTGEYIDQVEWEESCLNIADCIIFWVPRDMETMPALTTNTEWGVWQNSGKVVFGAPSEAQKVKYQRYYADKLAVPTADTLQETVNNALRFVQKEAIRSGGEREVPLYIWNTPHFQQWYQSQKQVGNRLDGARVEWTFRVGPNKNFVFLWALHVDVYIASEDRHKTNEVVIARPDIATIVMYRRDTRLDDSDIVLIKEFRSPVSNEAGIVWEVPGGSSFKPKGNPLVLAADECSEETGLVVEPHRIKRHESRQLVATLSAHKAHLFSVEITEAELDYLRSQKGIAHGVIEDTERTYVEILKLSNLKKSPNIDWSMLGMILSVLSE